MFLICNLIKDLFNQLKVYLEKLRPTTADEVLRPLKEDLNVSETTITGISRNHNVK